MGRARVIVTGASGQIGYFLLPRLRESESEVTAVARHRPLWAHDPAIQWRTADLRHGWPWDALGEILIHAGPLELLPPRVREAAARGVRRVVAFSSTSAATKHSSPDAGERRQAAALRAGEEALVRACGEAGVTWTLFRPTLIYGAGLDRNVVAMAAFIRRFGFLPLPGPAAGLRQPVHADDLARACIQALDTARTAGKTYELGGESRLPFRGVALQVCAALNRTPRLIPVPAALCRLGLGVLRLLPPFRRLRPALITRLERNLVADYAPAARDFGYAPRSFTLEAADLRPPE